MLERLYQKIFVAIVIEEEKHDVMVVGIQNKKVVTKDRRQFLGNEPTQTLFSYVKKVIEESPLHYVALLNPDRGQGAIEGCGLESMFGETDVGSSVTLCRNKQWLLYASQKELDHLVRRYSPVGLDFVFSPFSIIEHFFADKIGGQFALFALAQPDFFTIAFFENGKLEYGQHYPMRQKESLMMGEGYDHELGLELEGDEDASEGIRLDEIESIEDLDLIEGLDDLSDIEDLDAVEEIAEFSEETPAAMEEKRKASFEGEGEFKDDYSRFEMVRKTLARFYGSEHCHNRFVETVFIADAYGSSSELKRFLEEELFLNVLIRKVDLCEEVIALSRIEEEGL